MDSGRAPSSIVSMLLVNNHFIRKWGTICIWQNLPNYLQAHKSIDSNFDSPFIAEKCYPYDGLDFDQEVYGAFETAVVHYPDFPDIYMKILCNGNGEWVGELPISSKLSNCRYNFMLHTIQTACRLLPRIPSDRILKYCKMCLRWRYFLFQEYFFSDSFRILRSWLFKPMWSGNSQWWWNVWMFARLSRRSLRCRWWNVKKSYWLKCFLESCEDLPPEIETNGENVDIVFVIDMYIISTNNYVNLRKYCDFMNIIFSSLNMTDLLQTSDRSFEIFHITIINLQGTWL